MKIKLLIAVLLVPIFSNAAEHYGKVLQDGRIVGPAYSSTRCASKVIQATCNEFDAISTLKAAKKSGEFERVIIESELFHSTRVAGCENKEMLKVIGTICEQ